MGLKKVKKDKTIKLPFMKLEIKDIDTIVGILKSKYDIFMFSLGEYVVSNIEDIKMIDDAKDNQVNIMKISTLNKESHDLTLEINLSNSYRNIFVYDDEDIVALGIANKVEEYLKTKGHIGINGGDWFLIPILLLPIAFLIGVLNNWIYTLVIALVVLSVFIFLFIRTNSFVIFLEPKPKSFFKRKKDDILLALLSGFIGLICGALGTLIIQYLTQNK